MSDHYVRFGDTVGIVTLADIYEYKGYVFEWHRFCGPIECRKRDGEPKKSRSKQAFYDVACEWHRLPKDEREKFRWEVTL